VKNTSKHSFRVLKSPQRRRRRRRRRRRVQGE
jgi:hypothetical protein